MKFKTGSTVYHRESGNLGVVQGWTPEGDKIRVRWKLANGMFSKRISELQAKMAESKRTRQRRLMLESRKYPAEVMRYATALNLRPKAVAIILMEEGRL